MRSVVGLLALGLLFWSDGLYSQISQPAASLQLDADPQTVQIPAGVVMYDPQCDSSGAVYVRYSSGNDSGPATMVRVDGSGETTTVPPLTMPDGSTPHVFLFAVGSDDSLDEIVRVPVAGDSAGDTEVRYVTFDPDGSLRRQAAFDDELIPSTLLPLPSGGFFASGVVLQTATEGLHEGPIAGIFSPDAQLKRRFRNTGRGLVSVSNTDKDNGDEIPLEGAILRLGGDGTLYALLPDDAPRIDVFSQAGRVLRHMDLEQPFANAVVDDMFLSGNRLLVVYEGQNDDEGKTSRYVMYDAQSGEVIRQYRPEFSGTAACFEDGQTLTVLVRQPSSGAIAIGTAELE